MYVYASSGRASIAPGELLPLQGNASPRPANSQEGTLEANVLVVVDKGDALRALVSLDALFCGESLKRAVLTQLSDRIPGATVTFLASHTHYAPSLDPGKPLLGATDARHLGHAAGIVADLICDVATRSPMKVTQLNSGNALAAHTINRRKLRFATFGHTTNGFRKVVLSPAPEGPRDETLTTLLIIANNSPVAAIWNFACHPVSLPDRGRQSAHYVGEVRERIREWCQRPDLPVLFAQGFSGDIRPSHPSTLRPGNTGLRRLRIGPSFSDFTESGYRQWTSSLADRVIQGLNSSSVTNDPTLAWREVTVPKNHLFRTSSPGFLDFCSLLMGPASLTMVPGEPVVAYSHWLRAASTAPVVIPVGCANAVAGYLPTTAMIRHGGYEVSGFCRRFGVDGVQGHVEPRLKAVLRELLT